MYLKQRLNPDSELGTGKHNIITTKAIYNQEIVKVQLNINESPLLRLFSRKTKTGATYISAEQYQAGERLRADFEKGQLQPKISANLQGSIGAAKRAGFSDDGGITDFALDARKRISIAIKILGPELSGVTLDVCCYLKGLEKVECERAWPPRSAKLMLKTALSILANHYGINGSNNKSNKSYSWGGSDYRPKIDFT